MVGWTHFIRIQSPSTPGWEYYAKALVKLNFRHQRLHICLHALSYSKALDYTSDVQP